jgi:hypothetical protein
MGVWADSGASEGSVGAFIAGIISAGLLITCLKS